jgi:hypothetical protein
VNNAKVIEGDTSALALNGNLWDLSVVGPFIMGSVQMTKLIWSQRLQEILTTLSARATFQREQVHD